MTEDRTARLLRAVRDGWHGLGGGDAASCPGCPVCALGEQADRLDPATAEHLQAAAGHLVAAGRELLAALGDRTAATAPTELPAEQADHPPDTLVPDWTRIPVSTRPIDEEHA